MSPSSPVADYLAAIGHELAFDPGLARRVRREVEDHLAEAVACDPPAEGEPPCAAEQRAVARFGDARELAAQYRAAALYLRMRRTGGAIVLAIAGIFLAMEARVAWYAFVRWEAGAELKAVSALVLPIDRYAFLVAAGLSIVGWLYIISRSIPATYQPACRDQLRRSQFLAATAAASVAVAVGVETCLTAARLAQAGWSLIALPPAASILAEIVLILASAIYIRNTIRRVASCPAPSSR